MVQYQNDMPAKDGSLSVDEKLLIRQAPRNQAVQQQPVLNGNRTPPHNTEATNL